MLEKLLGLLKPDVSIEAKVAGISIFIGKQLDKFNGRIESLEARQLQKGDKGDKGLQGEKGKDGKDGKDGLSGVSGKDGKTGKDGTDGKDGVSVVNSYIAADGSLVLVLSNGTEIDAGEISGFSEHKPATIISREMARQQIVVSTTAPANPQVNDLWFNPQG